ncbi:MAG TPA: LysR family transcriptional regulator, partial [Devosia sp.]|nr:LysR family transcriptional regulator [Devosia sp.]
MPGTRSNSTHQRRYLPSHSILRSFECAARQESFTKAAEELHLTQSAISRQVKELEEAIGISLFRRVGRRVALTEAGRNLARELSVDLDNIRRTVQRAIAAGEQGSALRIAVLPTFASRWLIPRLSRFNELHPKITLNLTTRLKPFDMSKERFDCAIHFGVDNWPDTKMERILEEEMVAVCSPAFKKKHIIVDVRQLQDLPLLHLETRPLAWADWFGKFGTRKRQVYAGQQFDQFSMLIAGALASLGAALLPKYLIEDELKSGTLVYLSDMHLRTKNRYFVVTEAGKHLPHIDTFIAWIKSVAPPSSHHHSGN